VILPITMFFLILSSITVFSFFKWAHNKRYILNHRIAVQKAKYNAESGLADKAFKTLISTHFTAVDTVLEGRQLDTVPWEKRYRSQGIYRNVELKQDISSISTVQLLASSEGVAYVKNQKGDIVPVTRKAGMTFDQKSLAAYMYLTDSEKAGGGPFVFSSGERRNVTFGAGDSMGGGNIQSNGTMVMSDYGCPTFTNTVWITYGQSIDMGSCNPNQVFQGDPDTMSMPPVKLPPSGYQLTKNAANFIYDAKAKLRYDGIMNRDTLIMTELDFNEFGFRVKQWWYLKPPHLKPNGGLPWLFALPTSLEWTGYSGSWQSHCFDTMPPYDLRTCEPYLDSLFYYQAKTVTFNGDTYVGENPIDPYVTAQHGLTHFDFKVLDATTGEPDASALIKDEQVYYTHPSVIYVKGGPVRVKGTYTGRYTVVTDEYVTYRRHAWPTPSVTYGAPPVDTVWCNIWITDNLINSDVPTGDLSLVQPDENCKDGSDNILGLVSGANVIIANTRENGARNHHWFDDIVIDAAIIAFDESFAMQYWQNTINGQETTPPWADGRGISRFGGQTGNTDYRGYVTVWGGIVQKYRGYMMRNNPGPYNTGDIGMDKDYHYDKNLMCGPPPFFPSIEFENDEKSVSMAQYGAID